MLINEDNKKKIEELKEKVRLLKEEGNISEMIKTLNEMKKLVLLNQETEFSKIRDKRKDKYNKLSKELKETTNEDEIYNIKKQMEEIEKYNSNDALCIIGEIRDKYTNKEEDKYPTIFKVGGCYYLAKMLKEIFEDRATIYILGEGSHVITKIDDIYYDIDGIVDESKLNNAYIPTKEEFDYFISTCYVGRNNEKIKDFEANCDNIVSEIKEELSENKSKLM